MKEKQDWKNENNKILDIFTGHFHLFPSQGLRTVVFHMDRNFDIDEGKQDWKNENNKILDIFTGHFHLFPESRG